MTAQVRTDGESDYVFVMNFSGQEQRVKLDNRSYTNMETGDSVSGVITLPVHGIVVLKRPA
ncbi:Beta-galactosidase BglY [compost metagenome]